LVDIDIQSPLRLGGLGRPYFPGQPLMADTVFVRQRAE
jgi:hypothetical protein